MGHGSTSSGKKGNFLRVGVGGREGAWEGRAN